MGDTTDDNKPLFLSDEINIKEPLPPLYLELLRAAQIRRVADLDKQFSGAVNRESQGTILFFNTINPSDGKLKP